MYLFRMLKGFLTHKPHKEIDCYARGLNFILLNKLFCSQPTPAKIFFYDCFFLSISPQKGLTKLKINSIVYLFYIHFYFIYAIMSIHCLPLFLTHIHTKHEKKTQQKVIPFHNSYIVLIREMSICFYCSC